MQTTFNRGLFEEKIKKVNDNLEYYKNYQYKDKSYQLYFANGDRIQYNFNINNIAHLLGINFQELKYKKLIKGSSTEEMMTNLINEQYQIGNKLSKGEIYETSIFSNYFEDKISSFKDVIKTPFPNDLAFICKYDRSINYTSKEIDGITGEYIIARENEDNDLILLFLAKKNEENDNEYVPQSVRLIKNDERFEENLSNIIGKQMITYATGLNISTPYSYEKPLSINPNMAQIYNLINKLKDYSEISGAIPNTIKAHQYTIKASNKRFDQNSNLRALYANIRNNINNNQLINLTEEDKEMLDETVLILINSHNDKVINNSQEGKLQYSNLQNEYNKVCESRDLTADELNKVKIQLQETINESTLKDERIISLETTQEEYYNLVDKIDEISLTLKRRK